MNNIKVGTRVIVNGTMNGVVLDNEIGVILYFRDENDPYSYYGIKFEKQNPHYHTCGGNCQYGYGFDIYSRYVKKYTSLNIQKLIVKYM